MVMSTMTVSANAFDDLKDDLKDDQALKLAAGYLVANEVQRLTKISVLELFLASTAVNYMDDKDLTNAVVKSLNEVVGFKNKIEEFQRTLVNQKAKELESQLKSIAEQIRVLDDEYSEKLKHKDVVFYRMIFLCFFIR